MFEEKITYETWCRVPRLLRHSYEVLILLAYLGLFLLVAWLLGDTAPEGRGVDSILFMILFMPVTFVWGILVRIGANVLIVRSWELLDEPSAPSRPAPRAPAYKGVLVGALLFGAIFVGVRGLLELEHVVAKVALVAGLSAVVAVAAMLVSKQERKHAADRDAMALGLGWNLVDNETVSGSLAGLTTVYKGHSHQFDFAASFIRNEQTITIVLFSYIEGSGRSTRECRQTLGVVTQRGQRFPDTMLYPRRAILDRLEARLGDRYLPPHEDPLFAKAFEIKGDSESEVYAFYYPGARKHLLQMTGLPMVSLETSGDQIVFAQDDYLDAEDLEQFANQIIGLGALWQQQKYAAGVRSR